jgi:4-hydroxy-4-methyl-2-oxoglutarate aldolase
MIGNPVSLIVRKHFKRPDIEKLKMFQGVATGFVVDAQNGTGALDRKIKPVDPEMKFAGPAMTADAEPRDSLPVQPAIALAKPGDVLVIATGGYEGAAVIGDNVAIMAKNQGLAAIVTDGLVRDIEGVLAAGIPVFCCGVSPNSPYARGPGRIGLPIAISRSVIHPGDVIIGDRDGVVVIPRDEIDAVIESLKSVREKEIELESKVKAGLCYAPWVDDYLQSDQTRYLD